MSSRRALMSAEERSDRRYAYTAFLQLDPENQTAARWEASSFRLVDETLYDLEARPDEADNIACASAHRSMHSALPFHRPPTSAKTERIVSRARTQVRWRSEGHAHATARALPARMGRAPARAARDEPAREGGLHEGALGLRFMSAAGPSSRAQKAWDARLHITITSC